MSCHQLFIKTYRKGAEEKTRVEIKSIFLLPKMSEREPAGKLINTPGTVDAAAINPINATGVPKLSANGFNTGFFDIVELRMAKAPTTQRIRNTRSRDKTGLDDMTQSIPCILEYNPYLLLTK